jgi:hypothetical protein
MLQAGRSRVRFLMRSLDFSIDLGGGVMGGRHVRLTTLPLSVSRLFRENVGASTSHNPLTTCYKSSFIFIYVYIYIYVCVCVCVCACVYFINATFFKRGEV